MAATSGFVNFHDYFTWVMSVGGRYSVWEELGNKSCVVVCQSRVGWFCRLVMIRGFVGLDDAGVQFCGVGACVSAGGASSRGVDGVLEGVGWWAWAWVISYRVS